MRSSRPRRSSARTPQRTPPSRPAAKDRNPLLLEPRPADRRCSSCAPRRTRLPTLPIDSTTAFIANHLPSDERVVRFACQHLAAETSRGPVVRALLRAIGSRAHLLPDRCQVTSARRVVSPLPSALGYEAANCSRLDDDQEPLRSWRGRQPGFRGSSNGLARLPPPPGDPRPRGDRRRVPNGHLEVDHRSATPRRRRGAGGAGDVRAADCRDSRRTSRRSGGSNGRRAHRMPAGGGARQASVGMLTTTNLLGGYVTEMFEWSAWSTRR